MDASQIGLILGITLIVVALGFKAIPAARRSRLGPWTKMFIVGAVLTEAYAMASAAFGSSLKYWVALPLTQHALLILRGGISALILYAFLRKPLSRLTTATFPIFWLLTWYFQRIVDMGLYIATCIATAHLSARVATYYADVSHWVIPKFPFPYFLFDAASSAVIVGAAYYVSVGVWPRLASLDGGRFNYGGSTMSSDETTRLLCGSAFLSGHQFRRRVLEYFEDRYRAFAPEIGLDALLVGQVCKVVERREMGYTWLIFFAALLALVVGSATSPAIGIALGVLVSGGVYLQKSVQDRSLVRRYFRRGNFDPVKVRERFNAELEIEGADAFGDSSQNLVVYSGFTPFVGAGINLGGWSFTVDVEKPSENGIPKSGQRKAIPFETTELYAAIDERLLSLKLDRLTITDHCFVSGAEIRDDKVVLSEPFGRPRCKLDDQIADRFRRGSDPRIRHYQWIRVHDWGNELIMSYFFRCALRGTTLFVEINRFLLTPLFWTYRGADGLAEPRFAERVGQFLKALFVGPVYAAASPFVLFARLNEGLEHLFNTKDRRRRREIENNPLFNYGASTTLRYMFSSDSFAHYFQKLDGDFYTKVLEHQVLDATVDFLDEHDIDTSDIRERRTTILNSGVIVQGGDVKAESLAVGVGAIATKSSRAPKKERSQPTGAAA